MVLLIDNPSFATNEVYEIQATDPEYRSDAVIHRAIPGTDVDQWLYAGAVCRSQSGLDYCNYTVGLAVSRRRPRPGSDLRGHVADSIPQCLRLGISIAI